MGQLTRKNDIERGILSSPLDSTNNQTTSGVACHHRPWTTHTVGRRRAWHDLTALGQNTQSYYVGRGMTSPPLDSTHGLTMSGVACHHHLWAAHTVERRRAWHAIIALRQHTQSKDVGRGMTSPPLYNTHCRTTSCVACHHRLWAAHMVEQRLAWHASIALRQHTQSKDVGRGMTSPPLDSTYGRTTSGVTCHHRLWTTYTVERRRVFHYRLWVEHTVKQCLAWHAIIAFGKHKRSNDVERGMTSPP